MGYTMKDSTYTYNVQTWTKLTVTPSNINNYLSASFTPTITRTTSGGAVTRYFTFIVYGVQEITLTQYKAVFLSNSKTALVSVQSNSYKLGRIANQRVIYSTLANKIKVQLRTSASGNVVATSDGATYSLSFSEFTPNTPTISNTVKQTTPDAAQFGLIKGFASASWHASVTAKTWTFTDTSAQTINPAQTLKLTANGATASSGSGTGTRSVMRGEKLVSATSLTGTTVVTNTLDGSASNISTLTVQDYIAPSLSALTVSRDSNNHAVITFNWSVAGVNKANTAANPCTSGTVTATWSATDNGTTSTTWSGAKTIIADGEVMNDTIGSCTITETAHTYDPDKSYTIAVTITDRLGQSSVTITTILATEFCTIDFKAGGKGIAFGRVATIDNAVVFDATKMRPRVLNGTLDTNTFYEATREDNPNSSIHFGIGSGGVNRGIWINNNDGRSGAANDDGSWLIYAGDGDSSRTNVYIPGKLHLRGHDSSYRASGYLGQNIDSTLTKATPTAVGTWYTVCYVDLPPGKWLLVYAVAWTAGGSGHTAGGSYACGITADESASNWQHYMYGGAGNYSYKVCGQSIVQPTTYPTVRYYLRATHTGGGMDLTMAVGAVNSANYIRAICIG